MKKKKTRDADLERNRPTLLFLGILSACALTLSAFEWRVPIEESEGCSYHLNPEPLPTETVIANYPQQKEKLKPPTPPREIIETFEITSNSDKSADLVFPEVRLEPVIQEIAPLKETYDEPRIFDRSEIMPSFPGGDSALYTFLSKNIKYPQMAKDGDIQGKVFIEFTVNEDGSISDVKVLRGLGGGISEEAIRVIKRMPDWSPGINNGLPVKVRYRMPLRFTLR